MIAWGETWRYIRQILITVLVCSIAACSRTGGQALHVGNGTEPQGLDPHTVTGVPEHRLVSTLFEGLVDVDPGDLHPVPAVAESWTVSDDGTAYTFHLRTTAAWSNGDPVTAHDFVYAWRRILSPGLGSQYAYMLHGLKNAKEFNEGAITDFAQVGVTAVDDYTLCVTLNHPTPYFLPMQIHFTWYPVHPPTIERFGRMEDRNTRWTRPGNLVGNGAFILERWVPNNVIEVVKNERYWNAANVRLRRILFYPIDNLLTEERNFRTGALQLTENVPITKVPVYRRDHPEVLHLDPYLGTYFYRINVTRPPLNDVRVRRALALALDRESLTRNVLTGGQQPARSLTVPGMAGYTCKAGIDYDPEGARRLLAEAGYPGGAGFPHVELLYNTSENHKLIAEAVQQIWKQNLKVEVSLVNQDWKVYLASQRNLDYQIARAAWIGDYVDPNTFLECFLTGGGNNNTGWSSKVYDAFLAQAQQTADPERRYDLFQQAERVLLEEAPIIPVYHYTRVYLKSPRVGGWHSNLLGYISFKQLYYEEAD
jgi:oligopeptide transport system substrate-binding protein